MLYDYCTRIKCTQATPPVLYNARRCWDASVMQGFEDVTICGEYSNKFDRTTVSGNRFQDG
jgi:hypothetical protein